MAKQSKITVKHYLNDRLKPEIENGVEKYPIYVRVTHERKNLRFKSVVCDKYYTKLDILETEIIDLFDYETEIINFIINQNLKNENINLVSILEFLNTDIKYCTEFLYYSNKIKPNLIKFINLKTGINLNTLEKFINVSSFEIIEIIKGLEFDIFNNESEKKELLFYKILFEFLEKSKRKLNIYDWKYKNINENFILYIKSKFENENFSNEITEIDNQINLREKYI